MSFYTARVIRVGHDREDTAGYVRFAPKADKRADVSLSPLSAITSCEQMQQVAPLFDDFVGSREQCSRHFEAERFGGLDVST